jgi:hypothetical protein
MRDPKLTREEATRLLDPVNNELIPGGPSHDTDGTLLDPKENDLIPSDDRPTMDPPELSPDYVAPKADAEAAPRGCGRIHVDLGHGLSASSCPSGGLSIFKDGKQLYSTEDLSPDDRQTIKDFREKFEE